jgi:hypothetical protein
MDQKLFQQRKDQLLYNQQISQSFNDVCQPLFSHLNIKGFGRYKFALDAQGACKGLQGASTDVKFLEAYLFKAQDNGMDFTKASYSRNAFGDVLIFFMAPERPLSFTANVSGRV